MEVSMRYAIQMIAPLLTGVALASDPGSLIAVFQPIEASAVQGSLEVFEESSGLMLYAAITAGPTGDYEFTLTDGHCDPVFAQAKSRQDFLGRGKAFSKAMALHFVREPVGIRIKLETKSLVALQARSVIVERLEPGIRVLSACGQLWSKGNPAWSENRAVEAQKQMEAP
jgi:hypothetical protein